MEAKSRPGRSGGKAATPPIRETILDAAEIAFADRNYEACSMRMVAEACDVNPALLHYYFGNKEGLFSAMFLRRASSINARRLSLLADARQRHGTGAIPVEELVRCFVRPTVEMLGEGKGPRAFVRLHARLRMDPLDFAKDLRNRAFNEASRAFMDEFARACPHLSRAAIVWRMTAMVGAYVSIVSQSGRVEELSGGAFSSGDVDTAMKHAIPFMAAGFAALEPVAAPAVAMRSGGRRRAAR